MPTPPVRPACAASAVTVPCVFPCAVRTPTGYVCKECVRQQQKTFDTAMWYDYLIGFGVTFVLSLIASGLTGVIASFLGFYMIFIAAAVGGGAGAFIADIALRAVNKRRSKSLFISCAVGVVVGALPVMVVLFFIGKHAGPYFARCLYCCRNSHSLFKTLWNSTYKITHANRTPHPKLRNYR
jgi:hypothetical protein